VNLSGAAAVLVAVCLVSAAFGGYEYSQNQYQAAAASSMPGRVSELQANLDPQTGVITTLSQTAPGNQSQIGQLISTPLIYSESFTANPAGSATSTNFPFLSQITPSSWGDTGIIIQGTGPSPARVSQTSYQDCIFVNNCTVTLSKPVSAGDMILVFVSGYSPHSGWQASSINDSLGLSFSLYKVSNWPAGPNAYTDSVYYATVAAGAASDSITVFYNSQARHSDPMVMDVTGSGLSVLGGGSQDCTSSCTTNLTTQPVPLGASYLAAAYAYADLGIATSAQTGWTEVMSGAVFAGDTSFMTAEYASSQDAAQSCTYVPILPSDFAAQAPGYLSITGTISSPNETLVITQPFVPASASNSTYVLTGSQPSQNGGIVMISGPTTNSSSTSTSSTAAYYVSLNIPVLPGNVVVDLENCGSTAISATLSVNIVT